MSNRAAPFHCPYCGDENLWPHVPDVAADGAPQGSGHGAWECRSCNRAFQLKMLGQLRRVSGASGVSGATS